MFIDRLQLLSVRLFAALGRTLVTVQDWIFARPRLSNWFFRSPAALSQEAYSESNSKIFAQHAEQERMLADRPRMNFYHEMIRRHIRRGDRVVDLGTGTGILAAFASWQGAGKVFALDHSAIIGDARTLAHVNHIRNVDFIATHSSRFHLEKPVDVILHEQMGDVLFDEDMVLNVLDLRDRMLRAGGKILPARFEFYCEPVQLHDHRAVPFLWELNVDGFDFSAMRDRQPDNSSYFNYPSTDPSIIKCFLCEPMPLMQINLETLQRNELPLELQTTSPVVVSGRMDAYVVFFRALVDDDLSLSTSPLDPGRAPHWGFRVLRTNQLAVKVGDVLDMTLAAESWPDIDTWRWEQGKYTAEEFRDCFGEDDLEDDEEEVPAQVR